MSVMDSFNESSGKSISNYPCNVIEHNPAVSAVTKAKILGKEFLSCKECLKILEGYQELHKLSWGQSIFICVANAKDQILLTQQTESISVGEFSPEQEMIMLTLGSGTTLFIPSKNLKTIHSMTEGNVTNMIVESEGGFTAFRID